jgi:hypothetical protein
MTEDEWERTDDARAMLRFTRGNGGERKLRLLACACARARWGGLVEDEFRRAVQVAEQCADGQAGRRELRVASDEVSGLYWGTVAGDPAANGAAAATVADFAGEAADLAVANLPTGAPGLVRDVLGNPFRNPVALPTRLTTDADRLARRIYDEHGFEDLPRLATLLTAGGIRDEDLLGHLRSPGPHFRGCWALDAVLGLGPGREVVTEDDWLAATRPFEMLRWWEFFRGKPSARKKRLLACASCRLISHLMREDFLRRAVQVSEDYADCRADPGELARLYEQARTLGLARGEALSQMAGNTPERSALADQWRVTNAVADTAGPDAGPFGNAMHHAARDGGAGIDTEDAGQAALVRDILGSPRRQVEFDGAWRTESAVALARGMYESRDFSAAPVLADALEDAGCSDAAVLGHLRGGGAHVRGCWVVDAVLGLG